jgi:plastocyanin
MQLPKAPELAVAALSAALLVGSVIGLTNTAAGGGPAEPGTVDIQGFAFGPADLVVDAGATVTWTNLDGADHTVTQAGGLVFKSPDLATDDTFEVTFAEAGTYEYICKFHPAMRGTVMVEG